MRAKKEVEEYENEAFEKVWYMRSQPCDIKEIEKERKRAVKRVEKKYSEVKCMDDWDYGYWSGILAATRWVLGDDKNSLDT